ncbi:MbnP family protein [Flavobacterium sp. DGU11]|uniref:MbnP family protein n=1 Tax=Flavobacterium arundinis TaxID=3139143 RepID=A0ABU9HX89_9FLAO
MGGTLQKLCLYNVLLLFSCGGFAQHGQLVRLGFRPLYNNETLQPGKYYYSETQKDSLSFSTFRMYLSGFRFYDKGKMVHAAANSYYLIDINDPKSLNRQLEIPNGLAYDEIRFLFGIDDKTNNEGIGSGDLDPSKGMYWAWQTGYINMKLEGTTKPGKEFQFHLGGFLKPNASFQEISLKTSASDNTIGIDIAKYSNSFSMNDIPMIMSPGEKAVQLSQKAALMFSLL